MKLEKGSWQSRAKGPQAQGPRLQTILATHASRERHADHPCEPPSCNSPVSISMDPEETFYNAVAEPFLFIYNRRYNSNGTIAASTASLHERPFANLSAFQLPVSKSNGASLDRRSESASRSSAKLLSDMNT